MVETVAQASAAQSQVLLLLEQAAAVVEPREERQAPEARVAAEQAAIHRPQEP
jgi:hypothetical protein